MKASDSVTGPTIGLIPLDLYPCPASVAGIGQQAETVVFNLSQLFQQFGPPLVLKSDNGSPFTAQTTRDFCGKSGVTNLLSPPLTPQYNGSIESTPGGGGQFKTRAALIAQQQACGLWTSDLIEPARLAGNALNRPWGATGLTPDQRWLQRPAIADQQRTRLAQLIADKQCAITQSIQRERRLSGLADQQTAACRTTVARTATRQALVELGYLQLTRPADSST